MSYENRECALRAEIPLRGISDNPVGLYCLIARCPRQRNFDVLFRHTPSGFTARGHIRRRNVGYPATSPHVGMWASRSGFSGV